MTDRPTNGADERPGHGPGRGPSRGDLIEKLGELTRELETLRAEADEHLRSWQRAAADLSNVRRRADEEREALTVFANALLLAKLLPVLDDFDRALASVPADLHEGWVDGIRLVERKLRAALESEGVTAIEADGQPFDPNLHEAVVHEETVAYPDNQVIGELQRGYKLRDRVLRPSLVRVANNPKEN